MGFRVRIRKLLALYQMPTVWPLLSWPAHETLGVVEDVAAVRMDVCAVHAPEAVDMIGNGREDFGLRRKCIFIHVCEKYRNI